MKDYKIEVTAQDFEKFAAMEQKELTKAVENMMPSWVFCGYGYYGARLAREGNKFYVVGRIGDTCD